MKRKPPPKRKALHRHAGVALERGPAGLRIRPKSIRLVITVPGGRQAPVIVNIQDPCEKGFHIDCFRVTPAPIEHVTKFGYVDVKSPWNAPYGSAEFDTFNT